MDHELKKWCGVFRSKPAHQSVRMAQAHEPGNFWLSSPGIQFPYGVIGNLALWLSSPGNRFPDGA